MRANRCLVTLVIAVSAIGLNACSSSSTPGSTAASGGSTSNPGSGGSAGDSTVPGTGGEGGSTSSPAGGTSATCHAAGTLNVTNQGMTAYVIEGASNPNLTLCRGSAYTFAVNAPGHPFYINTVQGTGTANAYGTGVTGNGATAGDVTFEVGASAPDTLYYDCSLHAAMTGTITIVD